MTLAERSTHVPAVQECMHDARVTRCLACEGSPDAPWCRGRRLHTCVVTEKEIDIAIHANCNHQVSRIERVIDDPRYRGHTAENIARGKAIGTYR